MENLVFSDVTLALSFLLTVCLCYAGFKVAHKTLLCYGDYSEEFDRIDTAIENYTDAEIDEYMLDMAWTEAIKENEEFNEITADSELQTLKAECKICPLGLCVQGECQAYARISELMTKYEKGE